MRVLLVDHDSEALEAIARAIRGVLELDCVTSKGDALLLLRQNTYDVLIACERCVDGSGLDLLGRTTRTTAPLKRLFAAPPDRLQLLGPRLAPFKVQRTINYPIDLEELWLAIAQVTGTSDDTDGTIERVVLDERGIPSIGTTPRAPIPASGPLRSPAPVRDLRPVAPAPAPAIAVAAGARAAAARMAQPAPEPPVRPPQPPRQVPQARAPSPPATTSDTGRMRAPLPPATTSDTGRMRAARNPAPPAPQPAPEITNWREPLEDDFASVAAQARLGVERKVVDEAARRRKQRLIVAGVVSVVVAGVIMALIEKFYDPEARARERAIAAEVSRMAEQQKVTDNLTLIEIDIEKAIMENQFDLARGELAKLIELAPEHPRREFLQSSIDRAAELARLAAQNPPAAARDAAPAERAPARASEPPVARVARAPERAASTARGAGTPRAPTNGSSNARVYGAPLGEPLRQATIPLDAPINAPPGTSSPGGSGSSSFAGRTVEASDNSQTGAPTSTARSDGPAAGSAAGVQPPASTPAPSPPAPAPAPVEIVPAKLVKRVTPVVSGNAARKAEGFVIVSIEVTEEGRVGNVAVIESSPRGVFDDAALTAVRKWQYEPRRENGVAVASQSRARIVFEASN
jgi:TonB family protein